MNDGLSNEGFVTGSREQLKSIYGSGTAKLCGDLIEEVGTTLSDDKARSILDNLLTQRKLNTGAIARLHDFSHERSWVDETKGKVQASRLKLQQIFRSNEATELLKKMGQPKIIFYGSIQYGDPLNLDADVLGLVDMYPLTGKQREAASSLNNKVLKPSWKQTGDEPHFNMVSIPSLLDAEKTLYAYAGTGFWDEVLDIPSDTCIAMTGVALFEKDEDWLSNFQDRLIGNVSQMPVVRACVNAELETTIAIREERRV